VITANSDCASIVEFGRSPNRGAGRNLTFCEDDRESLGVLPGSAFTKTSPFIVSSGSLDADRDIDEVEGLLDERRDVDLGADMAEAGEWTFDGIVDSTSRPGVGIDFKGSSSDLDQSSALSPFTDSSTASIFFSISSSDMVER
jgi:hypothetical protein